MARDWKRGQRAHKHNAKITIEKHGRRAAAGLAMTRGTHASIILTGIGAPMDGSDLCAGTGRNQCCMREWE